MICLVICTEGDSSEPAAIEEFSITKTVPLGGNQGHKRLFEAADKKIAELRRPDSDSILSLATDSDVIEKWVICDYDVMDENGISEQEFRNLAREMDYHVAINKPNFEFFVLALLTNLEVARNTKPKDYAKEIDKAVKQINKQNIKEKGFSDTMIIPPYSKNKYAAVRFFGNIFNYNPELIKKFFEHNPQNSGGYYTEMDRMLKRITEVVAINSNN